jgi:hypothetical protein
MGAARRNGSLCRRGAAQGRGKGTNAKGARPAAVSQFNGETSRSDAPCEIRVTVAMVGGPTPTFSFEPAAPPGCHTGIPFVDL